MNRVATILSGSACCVYGLTFTSHFYGARRSVGYVPFNSEIEKCALRKGFKIMYEAFGDRRFNDDLSLVSRERKDALINTPNLVIDQITNIKDLKKIKSINGIYKSIKADTICIHSDTDNSIEILRKINEIFKNKE